MYQKWVYNYISTAQFGSLLLIKTWLCCQSCWNQFRDVFSMGKMVNWHTFLSWCQHYKIVWWVAADMVGRLMLPSVDCNEDDDLFLVHRQDNTRLDSLVICWTKLVLGFSSPQVFVYMQCVRNNQVECSWSCGVPPTPWSSCLYAPTTTKRAHRIKLSGEVRWDAESMSVAEVTMIVGDRLVHMYMYMYIRAR